MKKILEKLKGIIIIYTIGFFSYLIPKKKDYYVFVPFFNRQKFSSNIKALMLYLEENEPQIETALVTSNKNVFNRAKNRGLTAFKSPLKSFWATLRAEHIIIDASTIFFSVGRFSVIQLWHGIGFKKVALSYRGISAFDKYFLEKSAEKYQLIVSSSEDEQEKQNNSFHVDCAKVTGYPRNDFLFSEKDKIDELKKKYNLSSFKKIITYAPTWRDYQTKQPFSKEFYRKLNDYLKENNIIFIALIHPRSKHIKVPKNYSHIRNITKQITDPQEVLLITDLLISDYSSIITDFAITKKPIISYTFDADLYRENCRSFDFKIENILPKPIIYKENRLLKHIQNNHWIEEKEIKQRYDLFIDKFHHYLDGNSSKRVTEEIMEL